MSSTLFMLAFQHQESEQTLAAGMQEYYAAHPDLLRGRLLSPEAQQFFRCHDTAHVIFGCDVGLEDEAVVKIASMLGTTAGPGVLAGYRLHESLGIYRQLRVTDVLRAILRSLVILPRTVLRCLRQHERWPWADHQQLLDVPLHALRARHGITVAHRQAPVNIAGAGAP